MNPFVTNVLDFDVTSCEVKDKSVTARKNVTKPGKSLKMSEGFHMRKGFLNLEFHLGAANGF